MTSSTVQPFAGSQMNPTSNVEAGIIAVLNDTVNNMTTNPSPEMVNDMPEFDTARKATMIMSNYAIPCLYFILFVLGFIGNSVVVYVSCFLTKKSKNAVDIFVGNLAFADLALIATLPFWAVTHMFGGVWVFDDVGCKIISFLTNLNMYSSIFLITAMAVDRYIVVVKAVKVRAKSLRTVQRTLSSCAVIWVFAMIFALPSAVLRQETQFGTKIVCSWVYPESTSDLWWGLHLVSRTVFGFFIPLAVICRCYCIIISYVRGRSNSISATTARPQNDASSKRENVRDRQQQHVTRLVTAIILAFVICWMPNQISNFSHSLVYFRALPRPSKKGGEIVYLLHILTTVLSFCNSVINPVIYSTSPSHRRHIKVLFLSIFRPSKVARNGTYTTYVTNNKDPFGCLINCRPTTKPQDTYESGGNHLIAEDTRLSPKSEERRISNNCSTTVTVVRSPSNVSRRMWRTGLDEQPGIPGLEETPTVRRMPTGVEPPAIVINECSSAGNPERLSPPNGRDNIRENPYRGTMHMSNSVFIDDYDGCDDPVWSEVEEDQI